MPLWQFTDPPNTVAIADKQIIYQENWIAYVSHDADDGGWQFHTKNSSPTEGDAMIVSLQSVVFIDPTVEELADLPLGWQACRSSPISKWQRSEIAAK